MEEIGTPFEIILVIAPSVYQTFASVLIISLFNNNISELKKNIWLIFFLDVFLLVIPLILDLTVLANGTKYAQPVIFLFIGYISYIISQSKSLESKDDKVYKPVHFLTNMRATINIITVAAILAVDFPKSFPNRFKKTDYYGYSLMDVGVGLYVFTNGIVAPELYKPANSVVKSIISSIPMLILGLIRLFLTTITNYNVNPTEYGIHWNFFMTLAATKILSSVILYYINIDHSLIISAVVLVFHELLLQSGLGTWVLNEEVERNNLIFANREGIVSALGYLGLYFLSISYGKVVNSRYNKNLTTSKLLQLMILNTISLLVLTLLCDRYFGVSRRLASAGYCFWVSFIASLMGCLSAFIETCLVNIYKFFSVKNPIFVPLIAEAINSNGLVFFLFANILTGLINVAIINHEEESHVALFILFLYMIINCGLATYLFEKNIKITRYISESVNKFYR